MKRSMIAPGAVGLILLLGACGSEGAPATPTPTPATSSAAQPSPTATAEPADIVETAQAAGDFTTLAQALAAAGLVEALKGTGPYTVFAPSDEAFAKLPSGTLDQLLQEPQGRLAEILKYHVVEGEVRAADVVGLNGQKVKTLQGAELSVEVNGDRVSLVDAAGGRVNVVTTDVDASNGVLHVIDGVLMPTA